MSELSPFARDGAAVYRSVVAPQTLALIAAEYQIMLANDRLRHGDSQVDKSYAAYGLTVSDALMQTLAPDVGAKTGHALFSTYSYGCVYFKGASRAPCGVGRRVETEVVRGLPPSLDGLNERRKNRLAVDQILS